MSKNELISEWKKIISKNQNSNLLIQKLKKNFPPIVSITFTRQCILNCKHCLHPKGNQKEYKLENLNRIDKLIKATIKAGVNDLIHAGRILKKDHLPILKKYQDKNVTLHLIDNGNSLNLISDLKKYNIFFKGGIDISIDGDQFHHDLQRTKGSFKMAVEAAKKLRPFTTKISIVSTASTLNYNNLIKAILELKEKIPFIDTWQITTTTPSKHHQKKMNLNKEQMQFLFNQWIEASKKTEINFVVFRIEDLKYIIKDLFEKYGPPKKNYISIEWKINKSRLIYFPQSLIPVETFAIDANGIHKLPFVLGYHLYNRPEKYEMRDDLILKDPDQSYQKLIDKYWKLMGKKFFKQEQKIFKDFF